MLAGAVVLTPLGDVVNARLDDGKSNGVRMFITVKAVEGTFESPLIGFGSTRSTQGGRHSIAVGQSSDCERCGNFTIGGDGQLWQLLFAHGVIGAVDVSRLLRGGAVALPPRRHRHRVGGQRRDRHPRSRAMLWYNALVTPLALTFLAYAAIWRNQGVSDR